MYINFALNRVNDPGEEPYLTLNEVGVTLEQLQKNLTGNVVLGGLNVLHSLNPCLCYIYADKKQESNHSTHFILNGRVKGYAE